MYALHMEQEGEGCDYSIGCGIQVVKLKATTLLEAREEVKQIFDDYGVAHIDNKLKSAVIITITEDVMPICKAFIAEKDQERAADDRKAKQAEINRLQRELDA